MGQPVVRRALEELKMLSQTDLEREQYEARRKAQLDHNTALKAAQMDREQARQEAREEGRQEGRQQGRAERRQQGGQIGAIHPLDLLLNLPQPPTAPLPVQPLGALG